jgi:hypothetical protein
MTTSDQINEIAGALSLAQAQIQGAAKDSDNPFFRSRYADLASVWDACRAPLTTHGLAVIQSPEVAVSGTPEVYTWTAKSGEERAGIRAITEVSVVTKLTHKSGQWIESRVSVLIPDASPQPVGSAITYLRRYSLQSIAGVAPEDDDAEGATTQKATVMSVTAPKAATPKGPLTVVRVDKKETKRKNFFRWEVSFSDGRKAAFVNNDRMAALCEALAQDGREIDVVIERGEYGPELIEVVPVKQIETPKPEPAVAGQEQPF